MYKKIGGLKKIRAQARKFMRTEIMNIAIVTAQSFVLFDICGKQTSKHPIVWKKPVRA